MRIAINGFGRIGRNTLKALIDDKKINCIAINDLTDVNTLAYLLKYDSVYGIFKKDIKIKNNNLIINNKEIKILSEKDPSKLPWKDLNIDIVIESTGFFTDRENAKKHLQAGAKKVLISAPAKNPDVTIVKGVNENIYNKKIHNIISNGSCTTNCLAVMAKVLNDNFKIKYGFMTTAHAYTPTQKLLDSQGEKDLRRTRAAAINIIPTTSGATESVVEVIPELKNKLDGIALRVPVACGSIVDFVAQIEKPASIEKINSTFKDVSKNKLKNILEYTEDPIVSTDIIGNLNSCIFDAKSTMVLGNNFIKVLGWYDNELGYSKRLVDILKILV